jgi:hypothetical protein
VALGLSGEVKLLLLELLELWVHQWKVWLKNVARYIGSREMLSASFGEGE